MKTITVPIRYKRHITPEKITMLAAIATLLFSVYAEFREPETWLDKMIGIFS